MATKPTKIPLIDPMLADIREKAGTSNWGDMASVFVHYCDTHPVFLPEKSGNTNEAWKDRLRCIFNRTGDRDGASFEMRKIIAGLLEYDSWNSYIDNKYPGQGKFRDPERDQKAEIALQKAWDKLLKNAPIDLEMVTHGTFEKEYVKDKAERNRLTVDYYLRFNNNSATIKKVIANEINIPPAQTFTVKVENEFREMPFTDLLNKAVVGNPVLVKILAIGGVGKSSLLWQLQKEFSAKYYCAFLKRADPGSVRFLLNSGLLVADRPLLLFMDDLVSYEENRENLVRFGEEVEELGSKFPVVLIGAERIYRYDQFKGKKEFERVFNSQVYNIFFSNQAIRDQVFDKIFESLQLNSDISFSEGLRAQCRRIFDKSHFDSLIDSAFNLSVQIKKELPEINYRFDWEDWSAACVNKFEVLNELFKIVAFFYQFGIQVPLAFLKTYFRRRDINDLLRELLGSMPDRYTPIITAKMADGRTGLSLRHEKMGEWYFEIIAGGKAAATEFFGDFLDHIRTEEYSYLFRNIIRGNSEFRLSPYPKMLPNSRILDIIDSYLQTIPDGKMGDEQFKMLMEKHFILINLGKAEQANEPLEMILSNQGNNIFALSRLAQCLSEEVPARSKTLYEAVLAEAPGNLFAIFGLFFLYVAHPELGSVEDFQCPIFDLAKKNIFFTKRLLQQFQRGMERLPSSTTKRLYELYQIQKFLGTEIAQLLIEKKAHQVAMSILSQMVKEADQIKLGARNRVVQLLLKLYFEQNADRNLALDTAIEMLKINFEEDPDNPDTSILYARILLAKPNSHNYKKAAWYVENAYTKDPGPRVLFAVTHFYREFVSYLKGINRESNSSVTVMLLKGIKLLESRLALPLVKRVPYEIELALFYNELIDSIFHHAIGLADESGKYISLIARLEEKCAIILDRCIVTTGNKLPERDNGQLYSNYLANEEDVLDFSKACSIAYDFYTKRAKRARYKPLGAPGTRNEVFDFYRSAKSVLELSLHYNQNSPILLTNLVATKISLKDEDVPDAVEQIDFSKFNVKQKAKLCQVLLKSRYREAGIKLITRFGELNSVQIKIKNDLAFCYMEAGLWGHACRVLRNVNGSTENTFGLIKRIALEMPADTEEKAANKLYFARWHISKNASAKKELRRVVCETLFKSSNRKESFLYFDKNRATLNYFPGTRESSFKLFRRLAVDWQPALIDFLAGNIVKVESMIDLQFKYADGLVYMERYLNDLLNAEIDFAAISYNHESQDDLHNKVKSVIRKSVNTLDTILGSKTIYAARAFELILSLFSRKNILFDKIVLRKILFSDNKAYDGYKDTLVDFFRKPENNRRDSDIQRMIGRYFLSIGNYQQADFFFDLGFKSALTDQQQCYALSNQADLIITKIEKLGKKSFNGEKEILQKLDEAERNLNNARYLYFEFTHYKAFKSRLKKLRQQ